MPMPNAVAIRIADVEGAADRGRVAALDLLLGLLGRLDRFGGGSGSLTGGLGSTPRPSPRCSTAASPGSSGRPRRGWARPSRRSPTPRARRRRRACRRPGSTPTSSTAAPGRTMSPVMMPGTPAAATTMSARRTCAARSTVPVWQSVTVAFSERRVSSSPSGRPTVTPRPTTTTSAPAISTPCRRSSSTMPAGVQGSGASVPSTSQPRLVGCSPSASLAGSIRPSTRFSSRPRGSGSCTM